jgi:phage terminase large subunit GpA-like protein
VASSWTPGFIARAEAYGPDDLPEAVKAITGFCDVQGDRLEVQLIGWGADEESWPFLYELIHLDPAQPQAWTELDALRARQFHTRDGRIMRVAAFGVDTGGHHGAQVHGLIAGSAAASVCSPARAWQASGRSGQPMRLEPRRMIRCGWLASTPPKTRFTPA